MLEPVQAAVHGGRVRARRRPRRRRRAPARSTSASPWPTSQATSTQPSGGQPGVGGRTRTATTSRQQQPMPPDRAAQQPRAGERDADGQHGQQRQRGGAGPPVDRRRRQVGTAPGDLDDPGHAERGERARAGSPAHGQTRPTSPPARPSTVAGPTAGATARLATTATRLTCPEIAATSGVQASWAVAGTAIASASHRGSHRARASRQPGASSRMPAVATHRQREAHAGGQPGVDQQQGDHGRARARGRRARGRRCPSPAARPCPSPPPAPRSARCGPAARSRRCRRRRRRTASGRAPRTTAPSTSRKPTTSVRLVPETASRWVSPVVRKSSARPGSSPASSPSTSAGHQRSLARRSVRRPTSRIELAHRLGAPPPDVRARRAAAGRRGAEATRRQSGLVGRRQPAGRAQRAAEPHVEPRRVRRAPAPASPARGSPRAR